MDSSAATVTAVHPPAPAVRESSPRADPAAGVGPAGPLIVKFGAMGDMVMLTSMVKALSARFGRPVDVLSSGPWTRPLLEGQPGMGTLYLVRNRSLPFFLSSDQRALVGALRQRGAGPTWYCDTNDKSLHLLHRAGIGDDMICMASGLPIRKGEHLVDYWHRLACASPRAAGTVAAGTAAAGTAAAGTAAGDGVEDRVASSDPALVVPPAAAEDLESWLAGRGLTGRQLLLVQPGNKRTMRKGFRRRPSNTKWWPETRWAAVVREMAHSHPRAAILMLGVPQEHDLNQQIMKQAGFDESAGIAPDASVARVVNGASELPIPRLLALQAQASAMVSVDTGPAHSAAAVGCPVLVLFGVADPARNLPRGAGTAVSHLVGHDDKGPSMLGISVEQVLAAWRNLPKR